MVTRKKKKVVSENKGKKASSKVAVAPPLPTPPEEPVTVTAVVEKPAVDPWGALRSQYGGKLSPQEQWERLQSEDYKPVVLEVGKGQTVHEAIGVKNSEYDGKGLDVLIARNLSLPSLNLPKAIFQRLITLDLTANLLTDESMKILCIPNFLRVVKLTANRLSKFPAEFLSHSKKLIELDVGHNTISTLSVEEMAPAQMTLRSLNLENCGLTSHISGALGTLMQIRVLDLSSNALNAEEVRELPVGRLEELCIDMVEGLPEKLKSASCLKRLNRTEFSHSMNMDSMMAGINLTQGDDDLTKDSASCSCVEGNPCINKYNCKPWIWHRRFEIARMAREEASFDPEFWLNPKTAANA